MAYTEVEMGGRIIESTEVLNPVLKCDEMEDEERHSDSLEEEEGEFVQAPSSPRWTRVALALAVVACLIGATIIRITAGDTRGKSSECSRDTSTTSQNSTGRVSNKSTEESTLVYLGNGCFW
jgi:hypothetical protein